jgi:hypothetical protein
MPAASPKSHATGFFRMIFRYRIIPAYPRLHVLNPADVLFLPWQLAEPWASADIVTCPRTDPNVVDSGPHLINPFQNIVSSALLPHGDILIRCTRLICTEIKTAIAALLTGITFREHSISYDAAPWLRPSSIFSTVAARFGMSYG